MVDSDWIDKDLVKPIKDADLGDGLFLITMFILGLLMGFMLAHLGVNCK